MKARIRRISATGCVLLWGGLGCVTAEELGDEARESASDGAVAGIYEAEAFTSKSGCNLASNHAGFTGSGFMDYGGNGTWIEWNNISAVAAGTYTLTFRYANGGATRQSAAIVNGQNAGNVPFANTGAWTNWKTDTITVSLKEGANTIRVMANTGSGGPNLDSMKVEVDDICPDDPDKKLPGECGCGVPEGTCSALRYEAEDRTSANGCAETAVHAGFTGRGFMDYGGNGTWIEWNNIDIGAVGEYTLTFRYANGGATRHSAAIVNGQNVGSVPFANTGGWTSWKTDAIKVSLRQGVNTIRVMASSWAGGPNLDNLEIDASGVNQDQCPEDPDKTAPGICGCGVPDTDTDKDGTADCKDGCQDDPQKTAPGECGCGVAEGSCDPTGAKIDAVFFAQTHVLQPTDPYFTLVGDRDTLIKAHVIAEGAPQAPAVKAILKLNGQTLVVPLTGPSVLPASIAKEPGVVQHTYDNSFTGFIPKAWMKPGLSVAVEAGSSRTEANALQIGAPTKVVMTMFDVQYFADTNGDYPAGWQQELEAKWPVAALELRRIPHVVFPELVVPPRAGVSAARVPSKDDYKVQTGLAFDGEQAAALQWSGALKAAAGTSGRVSLYYVSIYGAWAGGQAGGFAGVGNGTSVGILNHELGHSLGLGDCYGGGATYPYKGDMFGIPAPDAPLHVGPTWAYSLYNKTFIPPTVQPTAVGGTLGTYKRDPMCGGGQGDQEKGFLMRHFSDYSVNKMRSFLESHVVVWNASLNSYASWDSTTNAYTKKVTNNGVQYAVTRDASVISIMAAVSGAKPDVSMVYPPIGPYTAGLIKLFDPRDVAQRQEADSIYCPAAGCDVSLRITQGGAQKIYMLAATWDTAADPLSAGSLVTRAINVPASSGAVTKVELLLTPDAEKNGLPSSPTVLYSWVK